MSTENEKQYAEPTQADEVFDIDDIPEMTPEEMEAFLEDAELSEDELDKIAGGYRVVGGVKQYAKGEKELYICPFSKNPKRMHKFETIGHETERGLFSTTEWELCRCVWCGQRRKFFA